MGNGVDERYDHPGKRYITVTACFHPDGRLEPLSFDWVNDDESTTTYEVQMPDVQRAASMRAGGVGHRYRVLVRGKQRYLYHEVDRWFVETKGG